MGYAPNAELVPCPVGAKGCHGATLCEAFGHTGCFSLGDPEAGGVGTSFGLALEEAIDDHGGWSVALCADDSDADGFTNGDELGDGCCAFSVGGTGPERRTDLSNPSFSSSRPLVSPSCSGAAPPAVSGTQIATAGVGAVSVTWTAPPGACVCEFELTITVTGVPTLVVGAPSSPHTVCNLPPSAAVIVEVRARNRGGRSAPASSSGVSGSAGSSPCSPVLTSPFLIDTAGSHGPAPGPPVPALAGVIGVIVVGVAFTLAGIAVTWMEDPFSFIRRALVHTYVAIPSSKGAPHAARAPRPGPATTSFGARLRALANQALFAVAPDLGEAGWGYIASLVALSIALLACTLTTSAYYEWLAFSLGNRMAYGRGVGYALAASLGFQLLPASRFSFFMPLFGVSFERSLKLHRWAGLVTLICALLHSSIALKTYGMDSPLGISYVFLWLEHDVVNPLAGVLSGACVLVLSLLSINAIRRRAYELFLAGHLLWPAAYVLGYMHVAQSDSNVLYFFLPPLALCLLDFALLGADLLWLREALLVDAGVMLEDGRVVAALSPSPALTAADTAALRSGNLPIVAAYLVIDKLAAAWGWHFSPIPGQFVYIALPGASLLPHPISISSVAQTAAPGRFSVHVKNMGAATWSGRVSALVARVVADAHDGARAVAGTGPAPVVPVPSAGAPSLLERGRGVQFAIPGGGRHLPPSVMDFTRNSGLPLASALTVAVAGPFGMPSLQLANYRHFVLVAGGIGITPIASLHHALVQAQSVTEDGVPALQAVRAARRWVARSLGLASTGTVGPVHGAADLSTLTTVWAVREAALVTAFAPLLEARGWGSGPNGRGRAGTAEVYVHYTGGVKAGAGSPPAWPWPTRTGRPDMVSIFRAAASQAIAAVRAKGAGRMSPAQAPTIVSVAVVVCGPQPLVTSALAAAAELSLPSAQSDGDVRVVFNVHRETFAM